MLTIDVSMSATGPIVDSFTEHFIQRWNFVKKQQYEGDDRYTILLPHFGNPPSRMEDLRTKFADSLHLTQPQSEPCVGADAQLCRSAAKWSQGVEHEKSIQNAYIDLITHAARMIPARCD